jgi:hypothetical protein
MKRLTIGAGVPFIGGFNSYEDIGLSGNGIYLKKSWLSKYGNGNGDDDEED